MAEADFKELSGGALTGAQIAMGKTASFSPPEGTVAFGFQALDNVVGFRGLLSAVAGVNPSIVGKGGSIYACIRKYDKGLFTPCIFLVQGQQATSPAYVLGLSEETPHKIVLRKGALNSPTKIDADANLGQSDAHFYDGPVSGWHNLRLDVCVEPHGDVVLRVLYDSALGGAGPVTPVWSPIAGIGSINLGGWDVEVDDVLGVRTGTPALQGGFYFGFGHYNSADAGHISVFDYVRTGHQTAP